jgi:hypothetical protein
MGMGDARILRMFLAGISGRRVDEGRIQLPISGGLI